MGTHTMHIGNHASWDMTGFVNLGKLLAAAIFSGAEGKGIWVVGAVSTLLCSIARANGGLRYEIRPRWLTR